MAKYLCNIDLIFKTKCNFTKKRMKAKRQFLLAIFVLGLNTSFIKAQNLTNQINIGYDVCMFQDFNFKSINLQYTLFPEKDFSLHYSLGFGTSNNMFYAHYPLTSFWGVYLLGSIDNVDSDALTAIAILSVAIPESISYNIELNNKMTISPYVLFNSHEFYYNENKEEELRPSVGFGSRFSYKFTSNIGFTFTTGAKLLFDEGPGIHTSGSIYFRY